MTWFKKKRQPRTIEYAKHSTWGDNIQFVDYTKGRVTGHLTPTPEKGDFLLVEASDGFSATFKFIEVSRMRDPRDQFFATVKRIK